jgi:hypothetical protein
MSGLYSDKFDEGSLVFLTEVAAESYGAWPDGTSYHNVPMLVTGVSHSREDHPGYDDTMEGAPLYDTEHAETGEPVPNSFYEYELRSGR